MKPSDPQPAAAGSNLTHRDVLIARAMLARLKAGKDMRHAKVERLKQSIESGDYENSLKLDVAADRMVEAIKPFDRQHWDNA